MPPAVSEPVRSLTISPVDGVVPVVAGSAAAAVVVICNGTAAGALVPIPTEPPLGLSMIAFFVEKSVEFVD